MIALKGISLRILYPLPKLRSKGDADILVKKEDMLRSEMLLPRLVYHKKSSDLKHAKYLKTNNLPIKLHRSFLNPGNPMSTMGLKPIQYFNNGFINNIW